MEQTRNKYAIGVFVGGSHVSTAAVDLTTNKIVDESFSRGVIESDASSGVIVSLWTIYIKKAINTVGKDNVAGIGFAMPGPFDYKNGIAHFDGVPKYQDLKGLDIISHIKKKIFLDDSIKIRFINDAVAFGIGEAWVGELSSYSKLIAIMLEDGFGSAFIESGIPVVKGDSVPTNGLVYNIPYKEGIADDYFSTRGILAEYNRKKKATLKKVKTLARVAETDAVVKKIFVDFGNELGEFLLPIVKKFGTEALIFGGNISENFIYFGNSFSKYFDNNNYRLRAKASTLNEHAFIYGGARLIDDSYWSKVESLLDDMFELG